VINRIADIVLSFPAIVLYIIVIMRLGPSAFNIVMAVVFIASPQIIRIVRGMTLELREQDYVSAAKMRGESALYIMLAEILPNARGPLIVDACLRMGYTTITIGVLGFLGLGLPPPDPDWGGMVKDTYAMMTIYPTMSLFPALAISSLVVGFSLLADGIREISLRD
jgi:peptide/nickel transport system permease protein